MSAKFTVSAWGARINYAVTGTHAAVQVLRHSTCTNVYNNDDDGDDDEGTITIIIIRKIR